MKIPRAGIVRRPKELDAFCRAVVEKLNALEELASVPDPPADENETAPEPEPTPEEPAEVAEPAVAARSKPETVPQQETEK
jgi:hypothetical protein